MSVEVGQIRIVTPYFCTAFQVQGFHAHTTHGTIRAAIRAAVRGVKGLDHPL